MRSKILGLFLLFSLPVLSQDLRLDRDTVPAFLIENENDTVGIVFSMEDSRTIDNKLEMLKHFRTLAFNLDTTKYAMERMMEDYRVRDELQNRKIISLMSENLRKDDMIRDQMERIGIKDETIFTLNKKVNAQSGTIALLEEKVSNKNTIMWTVVGAAVGAVVVKEVFFR